MINKSKLKIGWYWGIGRNSSVAYFNGETFLTIGKRFDNYMIKDEGLYEEGNCFMPIKFLAKSKIEGENISNLKKELIREYKIKRKYNYV